MKKVIVLSFLMVVFALSVSVVFAQNPAPSPQAAAQEQKQIELPPIENFRLVASGKATSKLDPTRPPENVNVYMDTTGLNFVAIFFNDNKEATGAEWIQNEVSDSNPEAITKSTLRSFIFNLKDKKFVFDKEKDITDQFRPKPAQPEPSPVPSKP